MSLASKLVEWLEQSKEDRGRMAALRHGLSEETQDKAWLHIGRVCNLYDEREELVTRTVAGCYALHPCKGSAGIGRALRQYCQKRKADTQVYEKHLARIVGSHSREDACELIPSVIRMLKAEGIPISYERLYDDLYFWGPAVQKRWCREYLTGGANGSD